MESKKYYFIGDVHGCADELEALIKKINPTKKDQIYCVGDLVNKGPDSNRVIDLVREYHIKSVLGNHDLIIKEIYNLQKKKIKPSLTIKSKHYKLYDSISEKNRKFISQLPLYIKIHEIKTIVVHAGILPNVKLDKHSPIEITCLRNVDPKTKKFVKRDKKGLPWYFYYKDKYRVIYGHNAAKSIIINKNTYGIDTACAYGNELTAYILPDDKFISVPSKKEYIDYTQGGKYSIPR